MWQDRVRTLCAGWTRVSVEDVIAHVAAAPSQTHAEDLAIAFGVMRSEPAAVRQFEQIAAPEMLAAARAIDRDRAFVDEMVQLARIKLTVGADARIASYRGTGPLRAWVAIAVRRLAINAKRDDKPSDPLADLVDREPDPELRHLKQLYRGEFREALAAVLAALPDRARAVLRLRFVDGLELAQIGKLYQVHESTASRWVTSALDEIATATRKQLITRLAVTAATADSVARMVQSGLDLSVARLLR
ncbi:MAG: sigma-70 family RNA polymerase sigma factor [Kofleriaceae bacterium]